MRTPYRKTSIVRAVDLRDRRQRLGLSSNRMADYLEVADSKHVNAPIRPGEAAWIALAENKEAIDSLESLQAAVSMRDRRALVALYEQIVCDPRHAAGLVAESIDRIDETIGPEAHINHAAKLMRKGVLSYGSQPLDVA